MIDHFELYQLPVSFNPDQAKVKARYYELSRTWHPDRFAQATEHEKAEALRMAAMNNDAYKTLKDADKTMAYVLKMNSVLEEEEKYNLPSAFLMEMMELNETVEEHEMEASSGKAEGKNAAQEALSEFLKNWTREATPIIKRFDEGEQTKEILLAIKEHYFKKKYLLRIQERIDRFASR